MGNKTPIIITIVVLLTAVIIICGIYTFNNITIGESETEAETELVRNIHLTLTNNTQLLGTDITIILDEYKEEKVIFQVTTLSGVIKNYNYNGIDFIKSYKETEVQRNDNSFINPSGIFQVELTKVNNINVVKFTQIK